MVNEADGESGPDAWSHDAPVLAGIATASVAGRVALGPRTGAKTRRCGGSAEILALRTPADGLCHARRQGFDLHAGVVVPARDRARLERTCRYALRPPIAHDRIELTGDGQVLLELRHRWADGTTHLLFDPVELLERLAALTPWPRINLVLYYGVLGAHAAWRSRLTPVPKHEPSQPATDVPNTGSVATSAGTGSPRRRSNLLWAPLMQRSFGFDVLRCSRCGGQLRLIALIDARDVIRHILAHLGLPTDVPPARPSRAPPLRFGLAADNIDAP